MVIKHELTLKSNISTGLFSYSTLEVGLCDGNVTHQAFLTTPCDSLVYISFQFWIRVPKNLRADPPQNTRLAGEPIELLIPSHLADKISPKNLRRVTLYDSTKRKSYINRTCYTSAHQQLPKPLFPNSDTCDIPHNSCELMGGTHVYNFFFSIEPMRILAQK